MPNIKKLNVKGTTYDIIDYTRTTIETLQNNVNSKNTNLYDYNNAAGALTDSLTNMDERLTSIERILSQINTLINS